MGRRPSRARGTKATAPGGGRRERGSPRKSGANQRTLFEISAGGVICRPAPGGVEVCLIATKGGTRWQLPKGKREPGESLEETAAREVAEETGLVGRVGPRLDKVDLWFTWNDDGTPVRHHKLVYFYLLTYERGSTADHDAEVHDARWFDARDALTRLTFPNERRVLERALEIIESGAAVGGSTESPAREGQSATGERASPPARSRQPPDGSIDV